MIRPLVIGLLALVPAAHLALAADEDTSKVMGSIHIATGQRAGDTTTVNGSIELGANSIVSRAETVNGSITLHEHASAASVETVNGSAHLGQGAHVAGKVELVNGTIELGKDADVGGHVSNVNGSIRVEAAHVGGGIETTNGDIDVAAGSRVEGGILVNRSGDSWFHFWWDSVPRVVVGPGAVVKGTLTFKREVKLYVSDRATIGPVEGATPVRFSGNQP